MTALLRHRRDVSREVSLLARLALGGVLLAAGGLKVGDPTGSVQAVQAYELLPLPVAELVGLALPWLEIALGLLLVAGWATRAVAVVAGVLMLTFLVGMASAWARGLSIDCGCFGGGGTIDPSRTRYGTEILRDLLFLGLAAWLVAFPVSRFALDRALEGARGRLDAGEERRA